MKSLTFWKHELAVEATQERSALSSGMLTQCICRKKAALTDDMHAIFDSYPRSI